MAAASAVLWSQWGCTGLPPLRRQPLDLALRNGQKKAEQQDFLSCLWLGCIFLSSFSLSVSEGLLPTLLGRVFQLCRVQLWCALMGAICSISHCSGPAWGKAAPSPSHWSLLEQHQPYLHQLHFPFYLRYKLAGKKTPGSQPLAVLNFPVRGSGKLRNGEKNWKNKPNKITNNTRCVLTPLNCKIS